MGVGKNLLKRIGLSGACKRELGLLGYVIVTGAAEAWGEAGGCWVGCMFDIVLLQVGAAT